MPGLRVGLTPSTGRLTLIRTVLLVKGRGSGSKWASRPAARPLSGDTPDEGKVPVRQRSEANTLTVPSGAWFTHRPPPPSALAVSILAVSPSDLPGISCKSDAIGPGDFRVAKPGVAGIQGLAHRRLTGLGYTSPSLLAQPTGLANLVRLILQPRSSRPGLRPHDLTPAIHHRPSPTTFKSLLFASSAPESRWPQLGQAGHPLPFSRPSPVRTLSFAGPGLALFPPCR